MFLQLVEVYCHFLWNLALQGNISGYCFENVPTFAVSMHDFISWLWLETQSKRKQTRLFGSRTQNGSPRSDSVMLLEKRRQNGCVTRTYRWVMVNSNMDRNPKSQTKNPVEITCRSLVCHSAHFLFFEIHFFIIKLFVLGFLPIVCSDSPGPTWITNTRKTKKVAKRDRQRKNGNANVFFCTFKVTAITSKSKIWPKNKKIKTKAAGIHVTVIFLFWALSFARINENTRNQIKRPHDAQ